SHVIILLSIVRAYDDIRFTKAAALYHCMMLIFSFSSFNFIVIPYSTTFSFLLLLYSIIFFFFSSRRRHTRCYRDWSSDVCSSDLDLRVANSKLDARLQQLDFQSHSLMQDLKKVGPNLKDARLKLNRNWIPVWLKKRSEERRVGKECRSRWRGKQEKKKEGKRREDH